ncbi:MAG: peptidoglycan DD-metalloendopeptidase family protein [Verrucomicrobiales bacterium]|nr:peptidoglycan DD-metalloendopeptidase family protein [Verrucomicrobiales bacterium]
MPLEQTTTEHGSHPVAGRCEADAPGNCAAQLKRPNGWRGAHRYRWRWLAAVAPLAGLLGHAQPQMAQVTPVSQWPGYSHPANGQPAVAVAVVGQYAYVADGGAGLQVIDVSNPANPRWVGGCDTFWGAQGVAVAGQHAYVADGPSGLEVMDVSNPARPVRVGRTHTPGYAYGVAVVGSYAYVADGKAGLQVIDISDPTNPVLVGGYDTPGSAEALAVAEHYAYVADGEAGLQVIDVRNPANPIVAGSYDTPAYACGVTVADHYAYVADGDAGLQVIDVSDPARPVRVGGYDTLGAAKDVALADHYAYVADQGGGLQVIDVSNPARPTRVGNHDTPGAAKDVAVVGLYAYLAVGSAGLQVIDISDLANPHWTAGYDTSGYAYGVAVAGPYAYVAHSEAGLLVIDVSDPANPRHQAGYYEPPWPATAVAVVNEYAYVATEDGCWVIDVSNPANPRWAGNYDSAGKAHNVAVVNHYAYVADWDGFQVIDVTDPSNPVRVGGYGTFWGAEAVAVADHYAYVAEVGAGLQVIDISDPTNPVRVGGYDTPDSANDVAVAGRYAYLAVSSTGLQVIDIGNPTNPVRVGGYDTWGVRGVAVAGLYAYLAAGSAGLHVIDISDPASPVRVGGYDTPGSANDIAVVGQYAYVADGEWGLQIFRIEGTTPLVQFDYPLRETWQLSQPFGAGWTDQKTGRDYFGHLGDDYAAPAGTQVYAIADGEVVLAQPDPYPGQKRGWGNVVVLKHELPDGGALYSLYAHLQTLLVAQATPPQRISRGQPLGTVGATGFATGPHLHLEIKATSAPGPGYSGTKFSGDEIVWQGVRYYRPTVFIEQRRRAPADGLATVMGTGGVGLSLRSGPGLAAERLRQIPEGDRVTVLAGLQSADGHVWRQVRHEGREGWVSGKYLSLAEHAGAPDVPPPTDLKQLTADGAGVISRGASVPGDAVALAARLPARAGTRYKLQVQVRPVEGAGTGVLTQEGTWTLPDREVRVGVERLSARGYRWRARVLAEEGRAGAWVEYGGGDATRADFTVSGQKPPTAYFAHDPPTVFAGDTVRFVARATQAGLSFEWSFPDGTVAAGPEVTNRFAAPGEYTVRLVVTDASGLRGEHAVTVPVTSHQLAGQIDRLTDRAITHLEEVLATARQLASAADDFQRGVDKAETEILTSAVFDFLGVALSFAQFKEWIRLSLKEEVVLEAHTEVVSWLADSITDKLFTTAGSFHPVFVTPLEERIKQQQEALRQLREQTRGALPALAEEVVAALAQRLQKRISGNTGLLTHFTQKAHLPLTYASLKRADEDSWSFIAAESLFRIGVGVGLIAAAAPVTGLAAFLLPASATTALATSDKLLTLSRQSTDAQMMAVATGVLADGPLVARQLAANARNGLEDVVHARLVASPSGEMAVEQVSEGGIQLFGFARRWFADRAYSKVTVRNTGSVPATYWLTTTFPKRFTTTQLLPVSLLGIGERVYDIHVLSGPHKARLEPRQTATLHVVFLDAAGGEIPTGPIGYMLLAVTDEGIYGVMHHTATFGTTLIDQTGTTLSPEETRDLTMAVNPVRATVVSDPTTGEEELSVHVLNPLELPVLVAVRQSLPAEAEVTDPGGAVVSEGGLFWELHLAPKQASTLRAAFKGAKPESSGQAMSTAIEVYDPVNLRWLSFQATPVVVRSEAELRPSWVLPLRFTAARFEAWLETKVPANYRIEVSTNLLGWEHWLTLTNVSGRVRILDPSASEDGRKFYRALVE